MNSATTNDGDVSAFFGKKLLKRDRRTRRLSRCAGETAREKETTLARRQEDKRRQKSLEAIAAPDSTAAGEWSTAAETGGSKAKRLTVPTLSLVALATSSTEPDEEETGGIWARIEREEAKAVLMGAIRGPTDAAGKEEKEEKPQEEAAVEAQGLFGRVDGGGWRERLRLREERQRRERGELTVEEMLRDDESRAASFPSFPGHKKQKGAKGAKESPTTTTPWSISIAEEEQEQKEQQEEVELADDEDGEGDDESEIVEVVPVVAPAVVKRNWADMQDDFDFVQTPAPPQPAPAAAGAVKVEEHAEEQEEEQVEEEGPVIMFGEIACPVVTAKKKKTVSFAPTRWAGVLVVPGFHDESRYGHYYADACRRRDSCTRTWGSFVERLLVQRAAVDKEANEAPAAAASGPTHLPGGRLVWSGEKEEEAGWTVVGSSSTRAVKVKAAPSSTTLHVGHLDKGSTAVELACFLRRHFGGFGRLGRVDLPEDLRSRGQGKTRRSVNIAGKHRGFAYVEFVGEDAALAAAEATEHLHGKRLDGLDQALAVTVAKPDAKSKGKAEAQPVVGRPAVATAQPPVAPVSWPKRVGAGGGQRRQSLVRPPLPPPSPPQPQPEPERTVGEELLDEVAAALNRLQKEGFFEGHDVPTLLRSEALRQVAALPVDRGLDVVDQLARTRYPQRVRDIVAFLGGIVRNLQAGWQ